MERQIIFLAMGYPYAVMATNAARSIRAHDPGANIKLVTNLGIARVTYGGAEMFDEIANVEVDTRRNRWIKTNILDYLDAPGGIFLDCDVELNVGLDAIWAAFSGFDFAGRNLPFPTKKDLEFRPGLALRDTGMSEFNTGVLFFRKNDRTKHFFQDWHRVFLEGGNSRDQPAFLKAYLQSETLRLMPLPPMWNATPFPIVDLQQMKASPKNIRILHYRDPVFWPSVGPRLAHVHRHAQFDLVAGGSAFKAEADQYSSRAGTYESPVFRLSLGRRVLAAKDAIWKRRNLRLVGEREDPSL